MTDDRRRIVIDRRPMAVVLASRLRRQIWLALLFGLFVLVLRMEPPGDLSVEGWRTLCIFGLCGVLWATALLPLAITSLLAIALVPLLGVMDANDAYAYFGSKVVFFILGAFMLSAALITTGLSQRLATSFVRRFGGTPRRLVGAVFWMCALASTVMSEHAVGVMVYPIVRDLTRSLDLRDPASTMARGLYFALMWGCVIGGSLTVLGGGRGPLAIGILEEHTNGETTVGFMEYILYDWPLVLMLLVVASVMLLRGFRPEIEDTGRAVRVMEQKLHEMGKVSLREHVVGLVLVVTVALWAFAGDTLGLANIAICSMAALFALRTLGWREVETHVNWGLVLMYGGAICLGGAMHQSGAALWLTNRLVGDPVLSPAMLMMALALVSALLTEFMSNSAVVAVLLPAALSMAETAGIDLRAMTMTVVLPTNFAFMFPIATPVTGIAWSSGFFTARVVAPRALLLHLLAWGFMGLLIFVWWPLIGLL